MYIKPAEFNDEETLLEYLFDFEIGTPSTLILELKEHVSARMKTDENYLNYMNSLSDQEEKMEVEDDEKRYQLAVLLLSQFDGFIANKTGLYGKKDSGNTLLYSIDIF
jgi:hypothetical protein